MASEPAAVRQRMTIALLSAMTETGVEPSIAYCGDVANSVLSTEVDGHSIGRCIEVGLRALQAEGGPEAADPGLLQLLVHIFCDLLTDEIEAVGSFYDNEASPWEMVEAWLRWNNMAHRDPAALKAALDAAWSDIDDEGGES